MKCILSRGNSPGPIDHEFLHITAATAPLKPLRGSLLHVAWATDAKPTACFMENSSQIEYDFTAVDQFWRVDLPGKACVWIAACPWGELPDLKRLCAESRGCDVYIPWRGWRNGLWFDGPLIWLENGQPQAILMPGADGQLPIDAATNHQVFGAMEWYLQRAAHAWKISLAWALRDHLRLVDGQVYHLRVDADTAANILSLIGLRLAFPGIRYCWLDRMNLFAPQWKRLAQNLNIEVWASPLNQASAKILHVDPICQAWPVIEVRRFLNELQTWIPIIPSRLLAALNKLD